jgi:hypothetical protein
VHRAGAPERYERVATRVHAALDRHDAQCAEHLLVGDADDSRGRRFDVEPEPSCEAAHRPLGRVAVEPHAARKARLLVQVAEQQVRVGHGRVASSGAVAGGSRDGAGGLRADPKRATGIVPADAASARSNGVHVHDRELEHPPADRPLGRLADRAVVYHRHVAGGAAHVEREHVLVARERTQMRRPDSSARRSRQHGPGRVATGRARGHHSSARLHDLRFRKSPARCARRELLEIAVQKRRQVGVDHGRGGALVLAKHGQHLVRGRNVDLRQALGDRPGGRLLVARVRVRMQEADRHRLGAGTRDALDDRRERPLVERDDDPVRPDPLPDPKTQLGRDERCGPRAAGTVELRTCLAPDLDHVGESLGGEQSRARAALGEQRVGGDGHAVREPDHVAGVGPGAPKHELDRCHHALGLVGRSGRYLGGQQLAVGDEHGVGERAADVYAEQHAVTRSSRFLHAVESTAPQPAAGSLLHRLKRRPRCGPGGLAGRQGGRVLD